MGRNCMTEKILKQLYTGRQGALGKYRTIQVGKAGNAFLFRFELCMLLFKNLPGLVGLALRRFFYRGLFKSMGRNVIIGAGVTLRNPRQIVLGDNVVIDDYSVLDAKGGECAGIEVGHDVFISRNVIVSCKDGGIKIGNNITIGANTIIHSVAESTVSVGDYTMIAANCYVIGTAPYFRDRTDIPMMEQGLEPGKGVVIERDVWLGAGAMISDGSLIREGSIIGALSFVRGEIPAYSIAAGQPATVRRSRKDPKNRF